MDAVLPSRLCVASRRCRCGFSSSVIFRPNSSRSTDLNSPSSVKWRLSASPVACRTVTRWHQQFKSTSADVFLGREVRQEGDAQSVQGGTAHGLSVVRSKAAAPKSEVASDTAYDLERVVDLNV